MAKHRAPFLNNDVIRLVESNKEPEQKLWIAVLASGVRTFLLWIVVLALGVTIFGLLIVV